MTRDETKKIVMVVASTYPNWHPLDMSFTVDAWTSMLDVFSYQQISAALKAFILTDTSGFAPSVGQLIGLLDRVGNRHELSEMEAWSLVSNALRRSTYYAESEFEKLPDVVQKAVGSPSILRNWAQTDMQSVENVIQSNFMRTYRTELARSHELRKIPNNVRTLLEQTSCNMIEGKEMIHDDN